MCVVIEMGTELKMQPLLFPISAEKDVIRTPKELAQDVIDWFQPVGLCLDPCSGDGIFLQMLPPDAAWCEISKGRDFYAWSTPVDWVVGNPPYSHYAAWMRQSMTVAVHIVYLMPIYKIFASAKLLQDVFDWGGIVHIRRYGTGSAWGFPFGYALSGVHYQKGYKGHTSWSCYQHRSGGKHTRL